MLAATRSCSSLHTLPQRVYLIYALHREVLSDLRVVSFVEAGPEIVADAMWNGEFEESARGYGLPGLKWVHPGLLHWQVGWVNLL